MRAILSTKPLVVVAIVLGTFEICWSQLDYFLKADVDSYGMGISRHKFCTQSFFVLRRSRSGVCSGYLHRLQ
jgi:hypothetical protein